MSDLKLKEYKQEITFLIDKQAKIYYHKIDLFHDHEDLLFENKLKEKDVCRLVYDPNQKEDTSFCGIGGIFASCNQLYDALPFELKSTHLNAIETWLKDYDGIVNYALDHRLEYDPDNTMDFVRSMNRIWLAQHKESLHKLDRNAAHYKKWKDKYPILEYLKDEEEIQRMIDKDFVGEFFIARGEEAEFLEDLLHRAHKSKEDLARQQLSECYGTELINIPTEDPARKIIRAKYSVDLARFLEITYKAIDSTGDCCSEYWRVGGKIIYGLCLKIAERACELEDEQLIGYLQRLKLVEPCEEGENKDDGSRDD